MKTAGASNFLCASQYASSVPPHPGPLPQGEGELFPVSAKARASGFRSNQAAILPLPEAEGRGGQRARQTCCSTMPKRFCFSYPATFADSWFRKWVRRTVASPHERISFHLPALRATLSMRRTAGWAHDGLSTLLCRSNFDSSRGGTCLQMSAQRNLLSS